MIKVPCQQNGRDCGCFAIYFARRFLQDPVATIGIIKVMSIFLFRKTCIDLQSKAQFSSNQDLLSAWGLKNADMTFVRREITGLLLKYIGSGEASAEYD